MFYFKVGATCGRPPLYRTKPSNRVMLSLSKHLCRKAARRSEALRHYSPSAKVSLRLGHAAALTAHRAVIHYRGRRSLCSLPIRLATLAQGDTLRKVVTANGRPKGCPCF